jgi:hypothetical protein
VELMTTVVLALLRASGAPQLLIDIAKETLGNQDIWTHNGPLTFLGTSQCGAMMGLGPGWTGLCVINIYCALVGGEVPVESFANNGDDLVGLWTADQIGGYEREVENLGLVLNRSKSYIHETRGVFCEQLVERIDQNSARTHAFMRIGTATGSKLTRRNQEHTHLDNLEGSKYIQLKAIRAAATRCRLRGALGQEGPIRFGGGGLSTVVDSTSAKNFILHGSTRTSYLVGERKLDGIQQRLLMLPSEPRPELGVRMSDIISEARERINWNLALNGKEVEPPQRMSRSMAKSILKDKLESLPKTSPLKVWKKYTTTLTTKIPSLKGHFAKSFVHTVDYHLRRGYHQRACEVIRKRMDRVVNRELAERALGTAGLSLRKAKVSSLHRLGA